MAKTCPSTHVWQLRLSALDVIAFGRYYPSIRSCIDCLIAMVDVNKCFVGAKPVHLLGLMAKDSGSLFDNKKPPLIKPPVDHLVRRPVS